MPLGMECLYPTLVLGYCPCEAIAGEASALLLVLTQSIRYQSVLPYFAACNESQIVCRWNSIIQKLV
eukprot:111559-Amphidinium_carterae.1